ncbi:MAG: hypothetical protein H8E31_02620 [Planctomycetes bacterium]|nr:hypothetical protein [Planctomycetota bacterium]
MVLDLPDPFLGPNLGNSEESLGGGPHGDDVGRHPVRASLSIDDERDRVPSHDSRRHQGLVPQEPGRPGNPYHCGGRIAGNTAGMPRQFGHGPVFHQPELDVHALSTRMVLTVGGEDIAALLAGRHCLGAPELLLLFEVPPLGPDRLHAVPPDTQVIVVEEGEDSDGSVGIFDLVYPAQPDLLSRPFRSRFDSDGPRGSEGRLPDLPCGVVETRLRPTGARVLEGVAPMGGLSGVGDSVKAGVWGEPLGKEDRKEEAGENHGDVEEVAS